MGWKKWMGPGAVLLAGIFGFGIWKQVEADRVKTVQEQLGPLEVIVDGEPVVLDSCYTSVDRVHGFESEMVSYQSFAELETLLKNQQENGRPVVLDENSIWTVTQNPKAAYSLVWYAPDETKTPADFSNADLASHRGDLLFVERRQTSVELDADILQQFALLVE